MNINVINPNDITESQCEIWKRMMTANHTTDSPFFHPEYVKILSDFRKQVRVAVVTEQSQPVAFFAFEKHGQAGRPLGIKLCDFQGIVRTPETIIDARKLLEGCDLKSWQFDHLVSSQTEFESWQMRKDDSLYIDLSAGYEEYLKERKQSGTSQISKFKRKYRKLEREIGEVKFDWHTDQKEVFDTILELKSAQRKRTGTFDILQFDWVKQFLDKIRQTHSEGFEGVLSVLRVNDQLIGAHMGMKTSTVLHHWFPVYDQSFNKYSPGLILLLKTAQAAAENGVQRMDLGKGDERYKKSLGSGSIFVGEGVADMRPVHHAVRSMWFHTREWIRASALRKSLQYPKRIIRSFNTKNAMN